MNLEIELALGSDTCFAGSGPGRAVTTDVDLERDPGDGLPVVRGRILKGLMVEELAQILAVLEPARRGPWHETAALAFGTPGRASACLLSFGDARLPDDLRRDARNRLASGACTRDELIEALTVVRGQTKMARDGAPEPHSLRSSRLLRAGLGLRAPLRCQGPLSTRARALLAAAAAAVRRGGLHRNHGWGELCMRLRSDGTDVTAAWLSALRNDLQDDAGQAATVAPSSTPDASAAGPAAGGGTGGATVLSYRLTLDAPALLSSNGGDASSIEGLPHVPGGAVLGAMAHRWLARRGGHDDAAGDPEFRRLFLDGTVRWLHAYPQGDAGARLLPCPSSLVVEKGVPSPAQALDRASRAAEHALDDQPDRQWVAPAGAQFVEIEPPADEDGVDLRLRGGSARRSARLHLMRDDREAGRSTDGAMFSYLSIDAGQSFVGHVLCETASDARLAGGLLSDGAIRLGRSRTATYGGWANAEILDTRAAEDWEEAPRREGLSAAEEEAGQLTVTLLSDYLGAGPGGQPDPGALVAELGAALGLDRAPDACFLSARRVAGYVTHWRMPRPTHPATAAGSVLVYHGARPPPERERALLWRGLGTRRAEGFGRVALQWHGALVLAYSPRVAGASLEDPVTGPPSPELAHMRRGLLANALRHALIHRGVADARSVSRPPSPSLIGRIRGRVRTAAAAREVVEFIDQASNRPADKGQKKAGQALGAARVGIERLPDWIRGWMSGTPGGTAGWQTCPEVKDELQRLGLDLDLLDGEAQWRLLQANLDAFFEALRRRAVSQRRA